MAARAARSARDEGASSSSATHHQSAPPARRASIAQNAQQLTAHIARLNGSERTDENDSERKREKADSAAARLAAFHRTTGFEVPH